VLTRPFVKASKDHQLTANVDFAYLPEELAGAGALRFLLIGKLPSTGLTHWYAAAATHGLHSQQSFLLHSGIGTRVAAFQRASATQKRADVLKKAATRLVNAAWMGKEYKVME
jgi:hypothetical protein